MESSVGEGQDTKIGVRVVKYDAGFVVNHISALIIEPTSAAEQGWGWVRVSLLVE